MTRENAIKLFQDQRIRVQWNDEQEKWFFSIVDVIEVLTGSECPRKYWSDLKSKLKKEGSQLSDKIGQLKYPRNKNRKLYRRIKRWQEKEERLPAVQEKI